jgi:hypothetical protein
VRRQRKKIIHFDGPYFALDGTGVAVRLRMAAGRGAAVEASAFRSHRQGRAALRGSPS